MDPERCRPHDLRLTTVLMVGLRNYNWIMKYLAYMRNFHPSASISQDRGKPMGFTPASHQARDSDRGATIPIFVRDEFKHVRARLAHRKTELLLRMDTIRKLDFLLNLKSDNAKSGRSNAIGSLRREESPDTSSCFGRGRFLASE